MVSPTVFGIVLLCFFLPWLEVSCQDHKILSASGIQLAVGTNTNNKATSVFESTQKKNIEIKSNILVAIALIAAIAALILSFLKGKKGIIGPAIAGGIGVISLLLFSYKVNNIAYEIANQVANETANETIINGTALGLSMASIIQLHYKIGFYLALIVFLLGIGVNIYLLVKEKKRSQL